MAFQFIININFIFLCRAEKDGKEQKFKVEKFWSHPQYGRTRLDFDNDIAVMKLLRPAQFRRNVNAACLPSKYEKVAENAKCVISGKSKETLITTFCTISNNI